MLKEMHPKVRLKHFSRTDLLHSQNAMFDAVIDGTCVGMVLTRGEWQVLQGMKQVFKSVHLSSTYAQP